MYMKKVYLMLLCLVISEWGVAQNAGGMVTRPNASKDSHKPISSNHVNRNKKVTKFDARYFKYDHANNFKEGMARVVLDGKVGYIDTKGIEVIPCKYQSCVKENEFREGYAIVYYDNKCKYIDKTGHILTQHNYDEAAPFYNGLACVKKDGCYGCINKQGHEVIPCKYPNSFFFKDGIAVLKSGYYLEKNGDKIIEKRYVNKAGKCVSPPIYSEGLAIDSLNGKWGFVDKTKCIVIPFKYDGAHTFEEGLAAVKLGDKWGYIEKTGSIVIPYKYDSAESFREGFAAVKYGGQWGFIDNNGREIVPCKYDKVHDYYNGLAKVYISFVDSTSRDRGWQIYNSRQKGSIGIRWKYGFVDTTGREVIPCENFDNGEEFSEGLLAKKGVNGKIGFVDTTGREVIPCKFSSASRFKEGLARIWINGKCGFIDKTGSIVIPCKYEQAELFSEGLAAVNLGGKWGFIDKTGKPLLLK